MDIVAFLLANYYRANFVHRYTRFMRVLVYINFYVGRELRRAFRNVRKTLPDIINVFTLFLISLLMFSFLGWQLFRNRKYNGLAVSVTSDFYTFFLFVNLIRLIYANELSYFKNIEDSITDLYVLITTANFPDVM